MRNSWKVPLIIACLLLGAGLIVNASRKLAAKYGVDEKNCSQKCADKEPLKTRSDFFILEALSHQVSTAE